VSHFILDTELAVAHMLKKESDHIPHQSLSIASGEIIKEESKVQTEVIVD